MKPLGVALGNLVASVALVVGLALKSLFNRREVAILTVLSIAISVLLFLGVEKVRQSARDSFFYSISGVDLLIGARSGDVQLLLGAVFHLASADDIKWTSYQDIAKRPELAWSVPLALGDTYRGFPILGTSAAYFDRYKYRTDQVLTLRDGKRFEDLFDAVIGSDVAETLGTRVGQTIELAHRESGGPAGPALPFKVSGILAKTGTPVDRTIHLSLEGNQALRLAASGKATTSDDLRKADLTPQTITSAMIGLKSLLGVFNLQRAVNEYPKEPLLGVIPGVAIAQLWSITQGVEVALAAVSALVVLTALIAMANTILTSLNARRREMAILRAVGARPAHIFVLLVAEATALALAGTLAGVAVLYLGLVVFRSTLERAVGLALPITAPTQFEFATFGAILVAGIIAGLVPAIRAYLNSLADGIVIRT